MFLLNFIYLAIRASAMMAMGILIFLSVRDFVTTIIIVVFFSSIFTFIEMLIEAYDDGVDNN